MPTKAPEVCSTPLCPNLTTTSNKCEGCTKQKHAEYQKNRDDDNQFYRRAKWRKLREAFLAKNRWCVVCLERGRWEVATHADHIIARRLAPERALDITNLRACCQPCHSRTGSRINSKKR